jgi:hypothetical protein
MELSVKNEDTIKFKEDLKKAQIYVSQLQLDIEDLNIKLEEGQQ